MAITIAKVPGVEDHVEGSVRVTTRLLTFDASYATGGYAISARDVGLSRLDAVYAGIVPATAAGATARSAAYNHTTGAIQLFTTASAEAANASDQSAFSARVTFRGV